jgi:hypothetical protein
VLTTEILDRRVAETAPERGRSDQIREQHRRDPTSRPAKAHDEKVSPAACLPFFGSSLPAQVPFPI